MDSSSNAPPSYTQHSYEDDAADASSTQTPEITFVPSADNVHFQGGYLGIEGEHGTIEGELQVKGLGGVEWESLTLSLKSVESTTARAIELETAEVVLYSRASSNAVFLQSYPFALPLPSDSPQCLHTSQLQINYHLTAKLVPLDPSITPISRSIPVHTRRYSARDRGSLPTAPFSSSISEPTSVLVQVPRQAFLSGEIIPVYVTVPSPDPLLIRQGWSLRNVKVELVRRVQVFPSGPDGETFTVMPNYPEDPQPSASSSKPAKWAYGEFSLGESSTHSNGKPPVDFDLEQEDVLSWTGASCRFSSVRPLQLRFLLHNTGGVSEPGDDRETSSSLDSVYPDSPDCGSITQSTILGSVSFEIRVSVNLFEKRQGTHMERTTTTSLPVLILPPLAPHHDPGDGSVDEAYRKKHDRPPLKTTRHADSDAPSYTQEAEAGPSAPPPFDDPDAPPPFVGSTQPSTSTRLPSFLESEFDLSGIVDSGTARAEGGDSIPGEGVLFGFPASAHYDGLSRSMPVASRVDLQTNVDGHPHDMQNVDLLNMGLEGALPPFRELSPDDPPPPPPPAMDDPMDPPPAINVDFISPQGTAEIAENELPPPHSNNDPHPVERLTRVRSAEGVTNPSSPQLPPPYLIPLSDSTPVEVAAGPPPYLEH
ncbi:hypothetical protein SISNIDRAFT_454860 [Sistotremastrum niveocremeum HHB9708]|uniref:Uncharacterized protein n=1 Tax=Sistotremastrum niveocremeum HHB9708 TaxID=1314777 RepID=A0A164U4X8_9AGAM|nr:hypothetical protein SISNIDRAFT_454860 [Sistotremastrum niveocremeum HHB9708]